MEDGWQEAALNPDRQGTCYWNPCIRTAAAGHADIALPELPDAYYIRLEGQTLDGRWFSLPIEYRFSPKIIRR